MEHKADRPPPSPDKGRLKEPLLSGISVGGGFLPQSLLDVMIIIFDGLAAGVLFCAWSISCMAVSTTAFLFYIHPTEAKRS